MTHRFSYVLTLAILGGICLMPTTTESATYHVQPTGCDDGSCSPCCTIQAAVDHCGPGDTVAVHTGSYTENVVLSTMGTLGSINLVAADGPGTVTVTSTDNPAIQCWWAHPGDIHIEGLNADAPNSAALWLHSEGDVTVIDVTIIAAGFDGFQLHSQDDVVMRGCTVDGAGDNGIEIHARDEVRVEGCIANNNPNDGIRIDEYFENPPVSGPTAVRVIDCVANNNGNPGVDSRDGVSTGLVDGAVTVTRTTTNGNTGDGLSLHGHASITIIGCEAQNNGLAAGFENSGFDLFMLDQGPVEVRGSTVDGNGMHGIEINAGHSWDITGLAIENCSVTNNADTGIDLHDMPGGDYFVNWTDIAGNALNGLVLNASVYVNAEDNWWGDPSGPSGSGPGIGDSIDPGPGTVDFDPWLTEIVKETPGSPVFDDPFETGDTIAWDETVG